MRTILIICMSFVCLTGCSLFHKDNRETRTVDLLVRDYDTGNTVAVFTITQQIRDDESRIYLTVKSVASTRINFTFTLNVNGYYDSFQFTNSVIDLDQQLIHDFGKISNAQLNLYDASIWVTTPIYVVFEPRANG